MRRTDDDLPMRSISETESGIEHEFASPHTSPDARTDSQLSESKSWPHGAELDDTELSSRFRTPASPRKNKNRRRLVSAVALLVITIGGVSALYYTFSPSRAVRVNIKAKQPAQAQDATAKPDKAPDDVTAEAIAEVRSAISNPPATEPGAATSIAPQGSRNGAIPVSSTVLPTDTGAADSPAESKQQDSSARDVSRRNREQSIRFPGDNDRSSIHRLNLDSASSGPVSAHSNKARSDTSSIVNADASRLSRASVIADSSRKLSGKVSVTPVVLPSFGSILPVRTLGKIYTLRSGSAIRLELTRYVSGEGWSLAKGTVLIGQVRGSERDRAFIAVSGFIDPSRDRFVNLVGEILGDDGGSGIRGKFHKLSSGWSRAFARVGSAAVNVAGAVAGSRISGQPVIVTDIGSRTVSPLSDEVDSHLLNQARGFVEVPAGTSGFVMVTTLPADVKGVDAEPDHLAQASGTISIASQSGALTEDELAVLLTSGDAARIREALPRMSPQMRRIAEALLAESSQREPDPELHRR